MCDRWEVARLSEHVDIAIGGTPSRATPAFWAEKPAGHPWLAISDLREKHLSETRERITDLGVRSSNVKLIPAGSTVMSFKLSVGRTAITSVPMFSNEAIAAFLPRSNSVDSAWLYHALPRAARTVVTDSAVKGVTLNKAKMAEMTVSLPSPAEQRAIAGILDTLDTTIRQTEAIIEKLNQVKQGLLHDLLTRGIDANGELRPPRSQAPHLYKDSPLGSIPTEWEASTVGESCSLHNSLRLPLASEVRGRMLGQYPYYGPTGVLDFINEFRVDGTFVLIGEDGDHFLKFASRPMTQLVSGKFNVNNHAHLLSGRTCRTEWVDVWFRHRDITLFLTRQGAGRFKLNKGSLQDLPIAVPGDDEQALVLDVLAAMEMRIATEKQAQDKLSAQKVGLMNDLLTGRVRVTALLDQGAPA